MCVHYPLLLRRCLTPQAVDAAASDAPAVAGQYQLCTAYPRRVLPDPRAGPAVQTFGEMGIPVDEKQMAFFVEGT